METGQIITFHQPRFPWNKGWVQSPFQKNCLLRAQGVWRSLYFDQISMIPIYPPEKLTCSHLKKWNAWKININFLLGFNLLSGGEASISGNVALHDIPWNRYLPTLPWASRPRPRIDHREDPTRGSHRTWRRFEKSLPKHPMFGIPFGWFLW